jgi:type IV secretory pathway VirB6-like protein
MKTIIFGAFALAFAVPAAAQTTPAADPHAGHAQHQAAGKQGQQHQDHAKQMAEMHKHCQEMMKHHGKMDHGARPSAPGAAAAGDHAGHHGN